MAGARISWWRTDLGDREVDRVRLAIGGRCVNQGPLSRELERRLARLLEVEDVVLTTSGTAALWLGLAASGVRPGQMVVIPALSFVATAHAAMMLGATVRLVDVRTDRPLIDPEALEGVVDDATGAIVPVHLGGRAADLGAIQRIAARYGASVVEDCAQALGSRSGGSFLGTRSDASAFSLGMTKLVTTGEGGFVVPRDATLADRLRRLQNQGTRSIATDEFHEFGFNFRFNDLLASVGLAQLDRMPEKAAAIRRVYRYYAEALEGLEYLRLLPVDLDAGELPLWAQVLCADRERVLAHLAAQGISARPFHPCLADSRHLAGGGEFPNARFFAAHGLTLPSGPDQPENALSETVEQLWKLRDQIRRPFPWSAA